MVELTAASETSVAAVFANELSERTRHLVTSFYQYIQSFPVKGCIDCVPAYTSITFYFDRYAEGLAKPLTLKEMKGRVHERLQGWLDWIRREPGLLADGGPPRIVEIPVRYGGAYGPDLEDVARYCGLSAGEVVQIHTSGLYPVHMIGFMPGFPYLGGLSERIATPRRPAPRLRVPAGSVGIAGKQTGVYPRESPGGWQIIGRTDLVLFDPRRNPPCLLQIGDLVRFVEVTGR